MLEFTAVFRKVSQGYVGCLEELPGANTQGSTLEEAEPTLDCISLRIDSTPWTLRTEPICAR